MKKLENRTNLEDNQNKNTQKHDYIASLVSNSDGSISIQQLLEQGISAIPLAGKRPQAKIYWKQYQHRLPSTADLKQWLKQDKIASYGIICGQVSGGIIVIDFDTPDLYNTFSISFPKLAQSYTVKTRRGFHVYLRAQFPVASRNFQNCDLKGEGGYVVGAGSQVDGFFYQIEINKSIVQITYGELKSIIAFLTPTTISSQHETIAKISNDIESLRANYLQKAPQIGRNNALYAVACAARREGIAIEIVIADLLQLHAQQKTTHNHPQESHEQRLREGMITIKSAFRNQARTIPTNIGLANSIREAMLQQQHSSILPRLLDAMRIEKWAEDGYFTLANFIKLGEKYHISKRSILRVLTGNLSEIEGQRVFKQVSYHKLEHPVCQGDKREPNSKRGRKTSYVYQVPSDDMLCKLLNVPMTQSDSLQARDLYSAAAYRRALHRELIRRLSPMIKVDWYGQRLGVHRRTIFRYNRVLEVDVTPTITYQGLREDMLRSLPERENASDNLTAGIWLQTRAGKRYPAFQSIAKQLLEGQEGSIFICKQLPSRYELPSIVDEAIRLDIPYQIRRRGTILTRSNIREVMPPDWAVKKFDLGGYIAIFDGLDWHFRPPLQSIAYHVLKTYDEGLVYFVRSRYGYQA